MKVSFKWNCLVLIFSLVLMTGANWAQPLTINLAGPSEMQSALENFSEQVLINVVNQSGTPQNVYFQVSITGNTSLGTVSIDNRLSAPGNDVSIPVGGISFTLTTLVEEYQNSSLEDFTIMPASFADWLQRERQLPAGDYRICLEARSVETGELLSLPGENNCLETRIVYRDPPIIEAPQHNSWVGESDFDEIQFIWSIASQRPDDEFTVEVVRIASSQLANDFIEQGRPQHMFNTFERIFIEEGITTWTFNSLQADILPELNPGDILAVRVTASSRQSVFLNSGHSQIHVFIYGVNNAALCQNPSISAEFVFPSPGDTLPFRHIFHVAQFEPICDNILEFEGSMTFYRTDAAGGMNTVGPVNYSDNWRTGPGPTRYLSQYFNRHYPGQSNYFFPSGSGYESFLPFLNDESDPRFQAQRGDRIYATGRVNFTVQDLTNNQEYRHSINLSGLAASPTVIGMPVPVLEMPADNAILPRGNVHFTFSTGLEPANPLPPFKIFKLRGNDLPVIPGLQVAEKCLLQVATDSMFQPQDIVFCQLKKIQANPYNNGDSFREDNPAFESFSSSFDLTPQRQFDQDHFMQSVYRDIDIDHDFMEADTFYWRVVWLKNPESVNVVSPCQGGMQIRDQDIYHASRHRKFILLEGEEPMDEVQDCAQISTSFLDLEDEGDTDSTACASPCAFPAISSSVASPAGLAGQPSFTAAGFTIEVEEASTGTSSNGRGAVVIPFLNNVRLRVEFSNIQINADRQMIAGTINPVKEQSIPLSEHVSTLGRLLSMNETEADAMEASLEAGGKLLSLLESGSTTALPVGIDKMVGGSRIIIGITGLTVKKDTAHMELVVNIRIPTLEELQGFISLGAQVCVTHEGFGNDVRLYLPQDQVFPMGGTNEFRIKGAQGAPDRNSVTSVEWDCNGFKALNLVGAVRFTRDWLLPEDERGNIRPTGQVEARMGGRFTEGGNMLLRLDMDNFQIPGAEGWGFTPAHNIWIDLSDTDNPPNLRSFLPEGYSHPAFSASGMGNTWKGFFMEELSVKTPEYLQGADRNRLTFAIRNMFIDHTGISFKANAENILRWDGSGDMNGWAASLDTIFFHMVQNDFRAFGFNGKLGLPIADRTQYMNYQAALVHDEGNINLVMSVRPADNLNIPISMANAVIERGTYVEVSIGSRSYIEANLCATLSIGNSQLPEGQSMPSTLRMPGIRIQNLKVNSETGLDTTDFAFSLTGMEGMGAPGRMGGGGGGYSVGEEDAPWWYAASEGSSESTLSGFPIGLDHFSFSNDRITIQPRLTLTGGEGGFSAAAKVSLLISMDLGASPQRFDVTGVQLERIDLAIETSEITLAGYLEFYKTGPDEGVRGGITLEISLGTKVGVNINADFGCRKMPGATVFNTEDWYSYFYVDGLAYLSSGITLFSGVSLFGLGGGFYHHMAPTGALPTGRSVAGASGSGSGASSGVLYRPDFNTDLGLKFMVILGSNDQGQAYNLDVKLEATFSFAHGLTMIRFEGSFRVMTEGISMETIGREGNASPIAGYVGMTLNMPPMAPTTFNGQFFVKLKVMPNFPVLTGLGTLDSVPPGFTRDNAMVWATFYAGPDKWFFHMGTPTNRCGVRLQIGDQELMRVTNYLMVGHDIPVVMPEPEAEFVRIFKKGMDPESEFTSSDGDVESLLAGQPRPVVPLGTGFAFGMSMVLNTGDISIFPFYFALKAVMGCDINVTQAPASAERRCLGSDRVPGVDGWYATGQFYAGIEGSFGILIPLFVTEIRATILEASAAMVLKGGLPNPEWVSGRGSFYYNVCDGLAEGRCSFTLTAGTLCPVTTGNPFAGIQLIQDISPANGATDVSVYTKVSAAFSMDMNRIYEIEEQGSPVDPPVIRRLQPYMAAFELKKEGSETDLPFSSAEWTERNHIYTEHPTDRLDGMTSYRIRVVARVRENGRDMMAAGAVFQEELVHQFTTGEEPDRIVDENLSFTYPYISQQTFYKGETLEGKGYVRCIQGNNSCLKPLGDVTNIERRWYARFTADDGHTFTSAATIMPGFFGAVYDVSPCRPNTLYCIQLIREDRPVNNLTSGSLSDRAGAMARQTARVPGTEHLDNRLRQMQITHFSASVGASTISSNQYKQIQLPSDQVGRYETQLYTYFFRTSRYHTMRDKLIAEQTGWETTKATFGVDFYTVKKNLAEPLEWVDKDEFKVLPTAGKRFTKRLVFKVTPPPLLLDGISSGGSLPPNQYLSEVIQTRVVREYVQSVLHRENVMRRITSANPGYSVTMPAIGTMIGFEGYEDMIYLRNHSNVQQPLTQGAIQAAFNPNMLPNPAARMDLSLPGRSPLPRMGTGNSYLNTEIAFELTIEGLQHYRSMRLAVMPFYAGQVVISGPIGTTRLPVDHFLTTAERTFFQRHVSASTLRAQSLWINFRKGAQTMGMQYLFPDQNGRDVQGTMHPFTFRT